MPPDVGFLTRRAITVRRPPRGAAFLRLKGKACWLCGDFSACWCGKIGIEVGCFIVGTCVAPWSVMVGLGRLFAATVSTVPGHRARPPARHWLRQWLCYRRCYEWLRMTPAR